MVDGLDDLPLPYASFRLIDVGDAEDVADRLVPIRNVLQAGYRTHEGWLRHLRAAADYDTLRMHPAYVAGNALYHARIAEAEAAAVAEARRLQEAAEREAAEREAAEREAAERAAAEERARVVEEQRRL